MNRLKNFFYLKLSHFEKKTFFRSAMKHRCSLSLGWIKLLKANKVFKSFAMLASVLQIS